MVMMMVVASSQSTIPVLRGVSSHGGSWSKHVARRRVHTEDLGADQQSPPLLLNEANNSVPTRCGAPSHHPLLSQCKETPLTLPDTGPEAHRILFLYKLIHSFEKNENDLVPIYQMRKHTHTHNGTRAHTHTPQ